MVLELGDFKVVSDERQFIVKRKRVVKAGRLTKEENVGNEYWEDIAYCTDFNYAIKTIGRQILLENDDLSDIKKKLDELNAKVDAMVELLSVRKDF